MGGRPKITWWIPRWAFAPRVWRSLQQCVLNRRSLTVIFAGSFVSCAVIVVALKLALPALVIPNLWAAVAAIPGVVLALVLQSALLTVIPPHVTLRDDRLQKSHGQTGIQIKAREFLAATIYVHRDDRVRLKLRYRRAKRERTLVLGVASTVDLDRLVELLPVEPVIRDARSRRPHALLRPMFA